VNTASFFWKSSLASGMAVTRRGCVGGGGAAASAVAAATAVSVNVRGRCLKDLLLRR
jgi:hypothetical protein